MKEEARDFSGATPELTEVLAKAMAVFVTAPWLTTYYKGVHIPIMNMPDGYQITWPELYLMFQSLLETPTLAAERDRLRAENEKPREALSERDLFISPQELERAADEIDSCPGCNDVAETLRALAQVARALSTSESSNAD